MTSPARLFDYIVIGLVVFTVVAAVAAVVGAYWDDVRAFWKDTHED